MLKLHQQFGNRYRFLLIFCVLLLISLLFQGQLTAKIEREKSGVEKRNKELRQINKDQQEQLENLDERIKRLEKDVKAIEIAKRKKQEEIRLARASQTSFTTLPSTSNNKILNMIYDVWWEDTRFNALIMCESGYNNWADGYDVAYDQHNYGLFQVSEGHGFSRAQLADPIFNIKTAKQIWNTRKAERGVWWAWYAWPNCSKEAGFI